MSHKSKPAHKGAPSVSKTGGIGFYLAILFAVAFLLLLLAFFTQQRAKDEAFDNLAQSITSIESLNQLINENKELRDELESTEKELEQTKDALSSANGTLSEQKNVLDSIKLIEELEAAYVGKEYAVCVNILESMALSSRFTMPDSTILVNRVNEIVEHLTALGYDVPVEETE